MRAGSRRAAFTDCLRAPSRTLATREPDSTTSICRGATCPSTSKKPRLAMRQRPPSRE
jgi:hypothetical protein